MASDALSRLVEAAERDNLVALRKILDQEQPDLNAEVIIGEEYDLDEPDEIPLLFYLIQKQVSREAIELLLDAGMDLSYINREGLGAVDIAVKYRRKDILELCKKAGIDLSTTRRKSGMTPLMLAAAFNDTEMLEYLLEQGASLDTIDAYGMTALDYARKMGQSRMEELLKEKGAKHKLYASEKEEHEKREDRNEKGLPTSN